MRRAAIQKRERKQPMVSTIAVECHPGESHTNGVSNPPPLFFFEKQPVVSEL